MEFVPLKTIVVFVFGVLSLTDATAVGAGLMVTTCEIVSMHPWLEVTIKVTP